ncbi:hypothetical protein IWQ62_000613 [Dispira parvispora]|uniref:Uncharacterized protein n=1 Tax=Dispira parvispora TaxID=1520584 RepID=A0A9W8AZT9_9FUNG|nr:hypothetical protein IWQ62_000613 [Dispira parvispora]
MLPKPPELAAAMAAQLPSRSIKDNSSLVRSPTAVPLLPISYPPSTSGPPGHHPPPPPPPPQPPQLPLSTATRPTLAPLSTVIAQAHQSNPPRPSQPSSTMVTRGPASLSNFTVSPAWSEAPGQPLPSLPPPVHVTSKSAGGPSPLPDESTRRGDHHPPPHYCSSPSMSAQTRSPGRDDGLPSQYIPRAFFENMLELRQRDLLLQEKRIQTDQELLAKSEQRDKEQRQFMESLLSQQNSFLERQTQALERLLNQHMDFCEKYLPSRSSEIT